MYFIAVSGYNGKKTAAPKQAKPNHCQLLPGTFQPASAKKTIPAIANNNLIIGVLPLLTEFYFVTRHNVFLCFEPRIARYIYPALSGGIVD